jgi:hypothetical protein
MPPMVAAFSGPELTANKRYVPAGVVFHCIPMIWPLLYPVFVGSDTLFVASEWRY